jgi:hypothetical protein
LKADKSLFALPTPAGATAWPPLSEANRRSLRPISWNAAPYERNLSVVTQVGAKPCFLSSLRISLPAAALFRRRWIRTSSTSPSSSTARHRDICLPAMRLTISSKYQRELGLHRRCRRFGANLPT